MEIDRAAPLERHDLGDGAWVEVASGFVSRPAEHLSDLLGALAWAQHEVMHYDRAVPERRLSATVHADRSDLLRQTQLHLESRFRVRFSGVAAIWYRDGEDFQGLHSDREMRWLDDTLIAIVVLGTRRPFVLRPRDRWVESFDRLPAGQDERDLVLTPGEGDLLVMGGACQRTWLHGVPRARGVQEARVSLTWRWTSRRGRPDTNPTYRDAKRFS